MSDRYLIVVIDDDLSVCKALRRLLQTARMDVETYSSGESFLGAVDHLQPDCLVLDVRMPGMTGPELQEQLLEKGHHIPVVFITAHEEDLPPERGGAACVTEVLRKPFDDETLLAAIGRAVRPASTG